MGIIGKIFKLIFFLIFLFIVTSVGSVFLYKYAEVTYSPLMFIRMYQQKNAGKDIKMEHHWVPLKEMSVYLPIAVIASEDQNFLKHNGFDIDAIQSIVVKEYMQSGIAGIKQGKMRGGSTISQQTAKNVFLWPNSSWIRKGFEAYFTFLIEKIWSKQRIMEIYLNTIEMGNGIYGADAVAKEHFDTTAKELTRDQCAMIAASLPNPLKMNSANPSEYMLKRQKWIKAQMKTIPVFELDDTNK